MEEPPPGSEGPSIDDLVSFDGESTDAFIARTGAAEPVRLAPTDAVPIFRSDLEIAKGASVGLFEVGDPATGRHFTLYEFELSIARMLDGRRHASDVIENGVRLGIPVDLDGLNKFIRQLWRYGFLAAQGEAPAPEDGGESGWGERVKWDEATRTLFQTGLRMMRQGKGPEASGYFQAVLDADPGNAEAQELLAAIERGEVRPASPIGARPAQTAAPQRRARKGLAVAVGLLVVGAAAAAYLVSRRPVREAAPPPIAISAPTPKPPPPAWRTATVQRHEHPPVGELVAPEAGTVVWKKAAGARVEKGERIGILRTQGRARAGAPVDPAAKARIRELEALAKQDPVYRDFLEKERRALQRKRPGRANELPLAAPADGILSLAVESRARVERGALLATVGDAGSWVVDAFLDGEPPAPEAACELRGDAAVERIACRLGTIRPGDGGSQLTLDVAAGEAPWIDRSRSLRVRVAPAGTPPESGAGAPREGSP